jgi:hypothetical protein
MIISCGSLQLHIHEVPTLALPPFFEQVGLIATFCSVIEQGAAHKEAAVCTFQRCVAPVLAGRRMKVCACLALFALSSTACTRVATVVRLCKNCCALCENCCALM